MDTDLGWGPAFSQTQFKVIDCHEEVLECHSCPVEEALPGGVAVEARGQCFIIEFQTQQHKVALETSPKLRDGWCREGRRKRGLHEQEAGVLFLRHLTGNTTAHSAKHSWRKENYVLPLQVKATSQQPFLTPTQGSLLFSKNPTEKTPNAQCETQTEKLKGRSTRSNSPYLVGLQAAGDTVLVERRNALDKQPSQQCCFVPGTLTLQQPFTNGFHSLEHNLKVRN